MPSNKSGMASSLRKERRTTHSLDKKFVLILYCFFFASVYKIVVKGWMTYICIDSIVKFSGEGHKHISSQSFIQVDFINDEGLVLGNYWLVLASCGLFEKFPGFCLNPLHETLQNLKAQFHG